MAEGGLAGNGLYARRETVGVCRRVWHQYLSRSPLRLGTSRQASLLEGAAQPEGDYYAACEYDIERDGTLRGGGGQHYRRGLEAYLEQVLLPTLRLGQIVVMDNLAAHKVHRVRKLIEERSCELLYLPPYSPDYNPIEESL